MIGLPGDVSMRIAHHRPTDCLKSVLVCTTGCFGGEQTGPYWWQIVGPLVPVHRIWSPSGVYGLLNPALVFLVLPADHFHPFKIDNMVFLASMVRGGWLLLRIFWCSSLATGVSRLRASVFFFVLRYTSTQLSASFTYICVLTVGTRYFVQNSTLLPIWNFVFWVD